MDFLKEIIKKFFTFPFYLFRMFKIKNNKIFLMSFNGKGYGDSCKYIVENIHDKKLDFVWGVKRVDNYMPSRVRQVKILSPRWFYEMVTAKVWINNCRMPSYVRKRKGQFYIQTWHGGFPTKKVERAAEDKLEKGYVFGAKNDSKMIDIFLSNNGFMTKKYKTDFWYEGNILECGLPKNDILHSDNNHIRDKVLKQYNINRKCNICLYAPTFRRDLRLDVYNMDYGVLKHELEEKFGGEWKILIRLHPNLSRKSRQLIEYNNDIIDASTYNDMQELIVSSDFMISDYSSCILDYAIRDSKCCMYAPDIDEYKKDRDFYIPLDEFPFDIAKNNDELVKVIKDFSEEKSAKRIAGFFEKINSFEDGRGSYTINKIIKEVINGRE